MGLDTRFGKSITNPPSKIGSAAALTQNSPPAGGTGTAAGGYDTAENRDLMITSLTDAKDDIANLHASVVFLIARVNSLIDNVEEHKTILNAGEMVE